MLKTVRWSAFVVIGVVLSTSGCVTGRREIALEVPHSTSTAIARGAFRIGQVHDARAFENAPKSPSTPSIDGDVTKLSPADLGAFIGRQRNGYGAAMGDVVLANKGAVSERVRALLVEGLTRRGYTVTDAPDAPISADVEVKEFWAWFSPGMWSVSFEAKLETTLDVLRNGSHVPVAVKGYGINRGQVASDENWQLAYRRAIESFLTDLDEKLTAAGF